MKYTIQIDSVTYTVEIENINERPIVAVVDGQSFEVWPENEVSGILKAEAQAASQQKVARPAISSSIPSGKALEMKVIRAPIPGVIIDIQVKPGDEIEYGQTLFTIEAMKMRNSIRANRSGTVDQVMVAIGQTVNHNEPLLEFTE